VKKSLSVVAAVAALGLAVAGCGNKPTTPTAGASTTPTTSASPTASPTASGDAAKGKGIKACMVSDSGGFDDKSFNQTAYKGLQDAVTQLGVTEAKVESNTDADYAKNITAMLGQHCKAIVTVGFKLGDATKAAAKKNKNVDFPIVDYIDKDMASIDNIRPLVFDTAQAAFLGGYLAAGMTKSGVVGTWGGDKFSTVTIFMDGFSEGVDYYNKQKNKNVKLVGWNEATQSGVFIGGKSAFDDASTGQSKTRSLMSPGADIVMPVAGPSGEGALQAAKSSGGKLSIIWVDTDGYVSAPTYKAQILSSVYKAMDLAVTKSISDVVDGKFDNTPYVGTLKNDGVGLAPFHDFDAKVPAGLKSELDQAKADIISGKITLHSKATPTG
jgi:basic membrane protein A